MRSTHLANCQCFSKILNVDIETISFKNNKQIDFTKVRIMFKGVSKRSGLFEGEDESLDAAPSTLQTSV